MAQYTVKDPQGQEHVIEGPDGATPDEVITQAQQLIPQQQSQAPQTRGILGKTWDALGRLQPTAGAILDTVAGQIPGREPTGNKFLDVAGNVPKIAAETLAQSIPPTYSRLSLGLMAGSAALEATSPALKVAREGMGNQADSITGSAKGAMNAAWEDPSLIFSKGKSAARPLYEAAKAEMPGVSLFEGMTDAKDVVKAGYDYIQKGGTLEPAEALTYRKALDVLGRSPRVMKDALIPMRQAADTMAKASPNIAQADPLYQRGLQAESLRNLMPQNKYGGASAFKMAIITALEKMGGLGKAAGFAMSPAVSGLGFTAGGIASRVAQNPALVDLLAEYLKRRQSSSGSTE